MIDCDDVSLLFARDDLTDEEAAALDDHVAGCDSCFQLMRERASVLAPLPARAAIDPAVFEMGETIATGGMGRIVRAFDKRLGREVAIKEVLAPELKQRFEREALITARLQHPAIVPIYEAGTWPDGTAFYTMRLVPGSTLYEAIKDRTDLASRLALLPNVIAVTEAIAYAHSRGVIHRDLKPHNVLIGEFGETVVIDWGLAKQRDDSTEDSAIASATDATLTHAGTVVGTPCFMAPEQARGEVLDERADVFALGALLYSVVAGSPPYWDRSQDSAELITAVLERPPTPIAELAPTAPADLRSIIEHAMARELSARFRNAGELADELRRFQAGQLLASREYRMRDLLARWIRRHRALVALASIALVALLLVGFVAMRNELRARDAEREARSAFADGEKRGQRTQCAASAPALASPWTEEARDYVHRRFELTKLPFVADTLARVDAAFAKWSSDLAAARELVCDSSAPRPQLASELDCLGERTREARALISVFTDADVPAVLAAASVAEQITPISRCTTTIAPRTLPPATPDVTAVRDQFSQIRALLKLGRARQALPIAEKAVVAADATGDVGLRAAARVALGAAQSNTSAYDAALVTIREALHLAEIAQDDRARVQAWVNLVQIEYRRGKAEQAVALLEPALGAAERINDVALQTELMLTGGGAYAQLGKNTEAEALFVKAVELRRAAFGDRDPRLAAALSALGNAYAMKGDLDRGITAHRDAVVIAEAGLGTQHPTVGSMRGNLGSDYLYALRAPEAIVELEHAVAIARGVHGDKHRDVASALTELGTAQLEDGKPDAALATFARADAVWLEIAPTHPSRAEVLLGRYLATRALGKPASVADLEAALPLAKGLPPFIRARVELALGKALTGPRSIELVKASVAGFSTTTLPLIEREHADATAWLAAHGVK